MRPSRRTVALCAALSGLVSPMVTAPAQADTSLVLHAGELRGWHAGRADPRAARSELGQPATAALLRGATVQVSAARRGRDHLLIGAFVFTSPRRAAAVLAAWKRAHHGRRAAVGGGGAVVRGPLRHGVRTRIVWRDGARLGLVDIAGASREAAVAPATELARWDDTVLRTPLPRTAVDRVVSQISDTGAISKQTALQAFTVAFGNLPGVRRPSGPAGDLHLQADLFRSWALRYVGWMTRAQQRVVLRRFGLAGAIEPRSARRSVRTAAAFHSLWPGWQESGRLEYIAEHMVTDYQLAMPGFHFPFIVKVGTSTGVPATDAADTGPVTADGRYGWAGGPNGVCETAVAPDVANQSDSYLGFVLAHEMFHCVEAAIYGNDGWSHLQPWVLEGLSDWAALDVYHRDAIYPHGPDARRTDTLAAYVDHPRRILFTRTYDAVGYWGHVQDVLGNLWSRVPQIIRDGGSDTAAYADSGGYDENLLTSWASSVFRAFADPAWRMISPEILPGGWPAQQPGGTTHLSDSADVGAGPYALSQWVLDGSASAPLIHYTLQGHSRLRSGGLEYVGVHDAWFCLGDESGCRCPADDVGQTPQHLPLGSQALLAITGDPNAGSLGRIEFHRLDEFCHPKPKPPAPPAGTGESGGSGDGGVSGGGPLGCDTGCGGSYGEPHVDAFNGFFYVFQSIGEFTAVKAASGDFEIQVRQQRPSTRVVPVAGNPQMNVSVVTAVAVRVARAIVEVDQAGDGLTVRIDRRLRRLRTGRSVSLTGGGTVLNAGGSRVIITWPDRSVVQVTNAAGILGYLVFPSPSRAGSFSGLLGNLGGLPDDTFVGRDGRHYDPAVMLGQTRAGLDELYHGFGDSWRVGQASSLFTYARGRSTRTFTDRRYPKLYFFSIPRSRTIRAQALCRALGASSPRLLADCIYDVAVTGKRSYVVADGRVGQIVRAQRPPSSGGGGPTTTGATAFTTTCYVGDTTVPAASNQVVAPGTSVGIEADLAPPINGAQPTVHWTLPPGATDPQDSTGANYTGVFADLETPGQYSVQVSYAGDSSHRPAQSAICSWTVTG